MAKPGLYLLDGCLFAATEAPECYQPGQPGVRMEALRGYFLKGGSWKGSGMVDVEARDVKPATPSDILLGLAGGAPPSVQELILAGPNELAEPDDFDEELEEAAAGLRESLGIVPMRDDEDDEDEEDSLA